MIYCFWGFPYQLHPDEHTIVEKSIDMIARRSWEAYVYNRPDQFEIKCCAIIFQIFSYLKYHVSADVSFSIHKEVFYTIARLYTAFWGTALIPMSALLAGEIFKKDNINTNLIRVITAGIITFSHIFIEHSAYATPDITLTFFVVVIAYYSIKYLEGSEKKIYFIALFTGVSITIKYPAAIMTLYIALIVILKSIKNKAYKDIVRIGFTCAGIILATIFVIAPNLFTDIGTAYEVFINEARPNHLGADGLGFLGNLKYYYQAIGNALGYVSYISFGLGMVHLIVSRKMQHIALLVHAIYWVILSALSLHWLRWGFPMYIAYILIAASGFAWVHSMVNNIFRTSKKMRWTGNAVIITAGCFSCLSLVLSGAAITVWGMKADSRVYAMEYCKEKKILRENSIFEGYTPLQTTIRDPQYSEFELQADGTVRTIEKQAAKEYLVISGSFKGRYEKEPERYKDIVAVYRGIDLTYPVLFQVSGKNIGRSVNEIKNIKYQIEYLRKGHEVTGGSIYIYDLKPQLVRIRAYAGDGSYLMADGDKRGTAVMLAPNEYIWAIYIGANRTSFISKESDLALDVTGENFQDGTNIELWDVTGGSAQDWTIEESDGYVYLLSKNNMALTHVDGKVILTTYAKNDNQRWIIERVGE